MSAPWQCPGCKAWKAAQVEECRCQASPRSLNPMDLIGPGIPGTTIPTIGFPTWTPPGSITVTQAERSGCLWDGVKEGTPMAMACPCPKCSPQAVTSVTYATVWGQQ